MGVKILTDTRPKASIASVETDRSIEPPCIAGGAFESSRAGWLSRKEKCKGKLEQQRYLDKEGMEDEKLERHEADHSGYVPGKQHIEAQLDSMLEAGEITAKEHQCGVRFISRM